MRVDRERRRSKRPDAKRLVTLHAGSAVPSNPPMPAGHDWQTFSGAYFPGRRRHDLESLTAYCAYRSAQELAAQSSEELARTAAKRGQAGSTALQDWEDEGGAAP